MITCRYPKVMFRKDIPWPLIHHQHFYWNVCRRCQWDNSSSYLVERFCGSLEIFWCEFRYIPRKSSTFLDDFCLQSWIECPQHHNTPNIIEPDEGINFQSSGIAFFTKLVIPMHLGILFQWSWTTPNKNVGWVVAGCIFSIVWRFV